MSNQVTTDGKPLNKASREFVTIYAPDGTPITCAPIDARESLASGFGYTMEPPNEQQSEQQSVAGDAAIKEKESEGAEVGERETGESIVSAALSKVSRKKKA